MNLRNNRPITICIVAFALITFFQSSYLTSQTHGPDAAPGQGLWRMDPDYPIQYQVPEINQIESKLESVLDYLEKKSPIRWIDLDTKKPIESDNVGIEHPGLEYGLFSLISYQWGVTYAGMLQAAEITGDSRYLDYVKVRLETIEKITNHYLEIDLDKRPRRYLGKRLITPHNLDQCGAMTAALIKAKQAGIGQQLEELINPSMQFIRTQQKRLTDGTLARDRPLPDSLWLDDLYMSVPALAQMGKATGDQSYFDDACRQLIQMTDRMFVPELELYRHGWVKEMNPHPTFPWGRANGWTIMAATELLSVLPKQHSKYDIILSIYRQHIQGIVKYQGINGFWHQLLDRPETYAETSATAMFVFSIARGINEGWLDAAAFGPTTVLGWNALQTQIGKNGEVYGTCVGTGMGWDPAFYAYRPVSEHAAHGYGPVILAASEMIKLLETLADTVTYHDSAVHFGETPSW